MERTVAEFEALRALGDELGGSFTYDTTFVPADDGSDHPLAHVMTPDTLQEFYLRYLNEWRLMKPEPKSHPCSSGLNITAIDPYGSVHPCVQLRLVAGNLREQSFGQIWRESPVLGRMRDLAFSDLGEFQNCELLPYCIRCPGVTHLETGDLLACSRVAKTDATLRRAILAEKGIMGQPGGPRPDCE